MRQGSCAILAICLAALATSAAAETWNARTLLMTERSPTGCSDRVVQVTFTTEPGTLKVAGSGIDLKLPVAADGTVKQDVRLANGSRGSLVGKVATREFEYTSYTTGCRYNWAEVK